MTGTKARVLGKRASVQQKEMLLEYLEKNLHFAHALSDSQNGHEVIRKQWNHLALMLNGVPGGAEKSPMSWRKYWLDLREYTKQHAGTDKNDVRRRRPITTMEQRILNIYHWKPEENALEPNKSFSEEESKKSPTNTTKLSQVSRIRNGRASDLQKEELVKYFEEHPDSLKILNNQTGDSKSKQRIWIELTHKLNSLDGVMKPSVKWAKYWNDIVAYTKTRAHRVISGQKRATYERPPTEIEKRMLLVVDQASLVNYWEECYVSRDAAYGESILSDQQQQQVDKLIKAEIVDAEDVTLNTDDEDLEWSENAIVVKTEQGPSTSPNKKLDESTLNYETVCYEVQNQPEGEYLENSTEYYQVEQGEVEEIEQTASDQYETEDIDEVEEYDQIHELPIENEISSQQQTLNSAVSSSSIEIARKKRKYSDLDIIQPMERRLSREVVTRDEQDDEEEDVFEDKLSEAIFTLGSAAQNMATALNGLAKVLQQRRRNKSRRS